MIQLDRNFTLPEFTKSQTAMRRGIDNSPGNDEIEALRRLTTNVLQPVRDYFDVPVRISSGFRCLELNSWLRSKDTSQHILGQAADFEIPGAANMEVAQYIANELEFDQLILEFWDKDDPSAGWVHVSYIGADLNRNVVLTIDGMGTRAGLG
jgi:zinc D-Ala-D-Ala carboxypeptidase